MQMTSAPHLLTEDRAEFERLLDEVLRDAHDRPDLSAIGQRLNAAQLRTMALNRTALISTAAAAEYEHYTAIRAEMRSSAGGRDGSAASSGGPVQDGGAGLSAVVTVLAPVLAGTAALIFLLIGYLLGMLDPAPSFARTMVAAGWFFAGAMAVAILFAAVALLITAMRNSSTQLPAGERPGELPDEVARAKDAWRHALLERGILPFLQAALADPSAVPESGAAPHRASRLPKVGYSGPDFTGPNESPSPAQRPTFTSPDFTGPDFGGPEHRPE
ncbi:hypothetical protein [Streptomyces sp. CAU 1734]|uniref:hypothetical protein n=1 Tax=Streptomyces sp. CAU 1734 TaxID=3140360 RepID=UPI003260AE71